MKDKLVEFFSVFTLCIIFGFLVGLQLKSVNINAKLQVDEEQLRMDELLSTQIETNLKLSKELADTRATAQALTKQIEASRMTAGIEAVTGPGVIVTMAENPTFKPDEQGMDDNLYIIHDDDVLKVINELRDAGAEALSINGERILATSEVRCSGSTISINNNRYSVPYVITAIGDPDTLEKALTLKHGVIEVLAPWGVDVTVKKLDKVDVPAHTAPIQYKYATPVPAAQ